MAKKRTRAQKTIARLRKLQSVQDPISTQNTPSSISIPKPSTQPKYSFTPNVITNSIASTTYSHVKKDLVKIVILATLAIGIQVVLSLIISNPNLPFNIPLLGRR